MVDRKLNIAILDQHQSIIDGYYFRLQDHADLTIVGAVTTGQELEELLARHMVHVVILGLSVPTSPANRNPYPVLHALPRLRQKYPSLAALVVTRFCQQSLVRGALEAGARGYVLKNDLATIRELSLVLILVGHGGVYLSPQAFAQLLANLPHRDDPQLTRRQREVIALAAAHPGLPLAALAPQLGISGSTLRNLLTGAYARLGAANRTEAILKARELGFITPLPAEAPDPGRGA